MTHLKAKPKRRLLAAWLLGGFLYMVLATEVIADAGFLAIPFQAVMGAAFSIFLVGISFLVGLLFRVPTIGRGWDSNPWIAKAFIAFGVAVVFFGRGLPALAYYGSLLAAVFGMLHKPVELEVSQDNNNNNPPDSGDVPERHD